MQSSQKSSFSSSQSSSFQSSSIQASKAFEAFPGMGGIENLKLEESENGAGLPGIEPDSYN